MKREKHGQTVSVVFLSLLVGLGLAGCQRSQPDGETQVGEEGRASDGEALPPPEMKSEVLERTPLNVPAELANLRPVAVLEAGEAMTLYRAMGPLRLRVTRQDGTTLAEAETLAGDVLVVDRRSGVKVDGEVIVAGPLEEGSTYAIFALPTGGVRQEVTRSVIRPENEQERESRAQAERRREELQSETTRPSTSPTGG
jgi:hypothetical protein